MLGEEIPHPIREIRLGDSEAVAGAGDDEQLETLVGFDERIGQPHRVRGVDVVIDLAVHQQQVALQVPGQFGVRRDLDVELHLGQFDRLLVELLGLGRFRTLRQFAVLFQQFRQCLGQRLDPVLLRVGQGFAELRF